MSQSVLICDDAIFMRTMVADILTQAGFEVIGEAETVNVRDPIEPLIYQDATYCFSVPHDSQAA